ncbi:ABC transporter permease subunit [Leptospira sp. GIMC2001]|uniref:ABC transporter permease subunit n=1 Tax=Leptospira sp. GIMC2001 TaxID=1513297 RepID=UPI00234BBB6B|nr:ABC transporter permease subunit [Leptospira sp. GIMC2001]WCL48425.1 ABC transporter permease subunit [Leptospira sp. GIMC2001]
MVFENIIILFKKEMRSYFNTPIGYIFSGFFLLLLNFLFFFGLGQNSFWDLKSASMEQFFLWVPILFIIFIPAVTMRLWSEEERSGTLEILLTLPFHDFEVILGKFLSAWLYIGIVLLATFMTPLTVFLLGSPDLGLILAGYIGCFFIGGGYVAIGIFISSLTRDQISAYVVTSLVCLLFFLMGYQPVLKFLGADLGGFISYLSLSRHFESMRLGIWDPRNFYYFISFMGLLLTLNIYVIRGRR